MAELQYLSAEDVARIPVSYSEVIGIVEAALREKAAGRTECPPKPGVHPMPSAFIHAMPAFVPAFDAAGVKWVSGFPDNPMRGLPYITGLIVLNDPATGLPTTVMDCVRVTALRTAAVSGLAMLRLSRVGSSDGNVALLGCGTQGRYHLEMLDELFPEIAEVRLYDIVASAAESALRLSGRPERCAIVGSVREAVEGADVIITAVAERTEDAAGEIEWGWLSDGALMLPLANDFGWSSEAMTRAHAFFVDDRAQFEHFRAIGELERSTGVTEVAEFSAVLEGHAVGRAHPEDRICSLNLGLAIHDIVLGAHLAASARTSGIGQLLRS